MILLQKYHIHHSLPPRWTAHLRGGWGRTRGAMLPVVPQTPLQKFFLLSDHLGRETTGAPNSFFQGRAQS